MKLPKIFFRKLIIGAVLLAIATGMTAFIKESLDTQDPESALPIITVLYGDEELVPDKEVRRAGWEWNFFLTQEKTPLLSPEDVPLQPVDVMPGAQIRLFTAFAEWHAILMCREPSAHVRLRGTILFCACPGRAAASQRPRPACR